VAGLAAVLTLGAAALAASGQIHLQLGTSHPRHVQPPPRHLVLPARTDGLALVTGGRLWVVAHGGVRIERLPVTTAALSPRALYVAVGAGRSLAAMAPSGRRAWAITTPGAVVAVAWAPSGLEVAYVVRRRARDELWLVEGDGDHAHRLASAVAPVTPAWRDDSLALAWVDRTGRVVVDDFRHGVRRTLSTTTACGGRVRGLAFAPNGQRLAAITAGGLLVGDASVAGPVCTLATSTGALTGIAWVGDTALVTAERGVVESAGVLRRFGVDAAGRAREVAAAEAATPLLGVSALPGGRGVVVATRKPDGGVRVVLASPPRRQSSLRATRVLVDAGRGDGAALSWR
jgi:hypothetical protein